MKQIIYILIFVTLFYTINAQQCGSLTAGAIMQQVTDRIEYVDGLFWKSNRLLYVDRTYPHLCHLNSTGVANCTKLEGVKLVSSVYTVKNVIDKLIIFADRKMILLNLNVIKGKDMIEILSMDSILTITSDPNYNLIQSVVDNKGRSIIGASSKPLEGKSKSKVFLIDANYAVIELIPENKIIQITGIVLTSDYKFLFIADSFEKVVYKYDYNNHKGTVGNHQIVFNMTEHINLRGYISTLAITKDNKLWIGIGRAGIIILYDWKKKQFLQYVKLPASFPTSITYGSSSNDVLFVGTKKENHEYAVLEPGSGAIFAISGTGTVGIEQNSLPMPKSQLGKHDLRLENGKFLSKSEIERMMDMDEYFTV